MAARNSQNQTTQYSLAEDEKMDFDKVQTPTKQQQQFDKDQNLDDMKKEDNINNLTTIKAHSEAKDDDNNIHQASAYKQRLSMSSDAIHEHDTFQQPFTRYKLDPHETMSPESSKEDKIDGSQSKNQKNQTNQNQDKKAQTNNRKELLDKTAYSDGALDGEQLVSNYGQRSKTFRHTMNQKMTDDEKIRANEISQEMASRQNQSIVPRRNTIGSLLGLFQCELFNVHMLFRYLKQQEQEGVIDFLLNKLYDEKLSNIDLYLPQLCFLIITKAGSVRNIEKFVLKTSIKYGNIGFRALQYFQSWSEDSKQVYNEKAMDFYQILESTLVNGDLPRRFADNVQQVKHFDEYCDKKFKADYIFIQVNYMESLKNVSIKLKQLEKPDQIPYMKQQINTLNDWIVNKVRAEVPKICGSETRARYQGITLPFQQGDDADPYVIMQALPELGQVFVTKTRAPYKIVFEVIKLKELINLDKQQQQRQQEESKTGNNNNQKNSSSFIVQKANPDQADNQLLQEGNSTESASQQKVSSQNSSSTGNVQNNQGTTNTQNLFSIGPEDTSEGAHQDQEANPFGPDYENNQDLVLASKKDEGSVDASADQKPMVEIVQNVEEVKEPPIEEQKFKEDEQSIESDDLDDWENISVAEMQEAQRASLSQRDSQHQDSGRASQVSVQPIFIDPFKDSWTKIKSRYQENGNYKHYKTYTLKTMIVKANDDCRQEVLAMQLMKRLKDCFKQAGLSIFLKPYEIFITSSNSAMIEFINDSVSLDSLKQKMRESQQNIDPKYCLKAFYHSYFNTNFEEAQLNFVRSLAGYSLFTYLFAIRDRHNGNILIDRHGHIIHIDFGFMFQNSPGGMNFESAPFKLTLEYVELMGGQNSSHFELFKSLINQGLVVIRKHIDDILILVEIFLKDSNLPCFVKHDLVLKQIRDRLSTKGNVGINRANEFYELTERLVAASLNNWRTNQYDNFQVYTNNIAK